MSRSRLFAALLSVPLLASCSFAQPSPSPVGAEDAEVRILVDPSSQRNLVAGEIYRQRLESHDRDAQLVPKKESSTQSQVEALFDGEVDFIVGCTGNLLAVLNPNKAHELEKDMAKAKAKDRDRDFLAETHIALMASLPNDIATVEPSPASGCETERGVDLPENYVVLYRKTLFDRKEHKMVLAITKFLTDRKMNELVQEAQEVGSPAKAVAQWLEPSVD